MIAKKATIQQQENKQPTDSHTQTNKQNIKRFVTISANLHVYVL